MKKIINAIEDENKVITAVKFKGNTTFTDIKTAINMAENKQIADIVVVTAADGTKHLRSTPDGKKSNNLGEMAKKN